MKSIKKRCSSSVLNHMLMLIFGLILLLYCMYVCDLQEDILKQVTFVANRDEYQIIENFVSGIEVKQEFISADDFEFITLSFSDHDKTLSGKTYISILDKETDTLITYREFINTDIHYGRAVVVPVENGKSGKEYSVVIQAEGTGDTALGLYGYSAAAEDRKAEVNGDISDFAVSIGIHKYTNAFSVLTFLIMLIGFAGMIFTSVGCCKFHFTKEKVFLCLAVPFGICMLLFLSNSAYDEERHFSTVYHYSNVLLGLADNDEEFRLTMRKGDAPQIDNKAEGNIGGRIINAQAQNFWKKLQQINQPAGDRTPVMVELSNNRIVTDSTIIEYLPEVIGITIGRLLNFNSFWLVLTGKLFVFVFYVFVCYYAVKVSPVMKLGMVFIASLPMNIYQATGYSYDGFTFAVGLLVFALIMRLWNGSIKRKEWLVLAISVFVLGFCKGGVYLSLLLLLFLIPKRQFLYSKWKTIVSLIFIGAIPLLGHYLPVFIEDFLNVSSSGIPVNSEGTFYEIIFVIREPWQFILMVIRTTLEKAEYYLGGILGYRTAWSNKPISWVVMLPFILLLFMTKDRADGDNCIITFRNRILIGVFLLLEFIGMHAIFLRETSIYDTIVNGFQGRYFLVFLPVILLILRNNDIHINLKSEERISCLFSMAQFVYLYYFIKMFMIY